MDNLLIKAILAELSTWPGKPLASHKSASQLFHKLSFLADYGLNIQNCPDLKPIIDTIMLQRDPLGIPTLTMQIGEAYGGSGKAGPAWALCDAPVVLCALIRLGLPLSQVQGAVDYLADLIQANGWPCAVSKALGTWRGPGKKSDPCPYATLVMTKLLIHCQAPERYSNAIALGGETLLSLWQDSLSRHPYIFYMGTDFRKLKLPFVWYDILHVLEVLSRIPNLTCDPRLREMLALVLSKAENQGYTPESVYQAWSAWDFGQKKLPSAWMTEQIALISRRF